MPEGTPLPRPFDPLRPLPFVFRPAVFRVPIWTFAKITRRQITSSQTPSSKQPTGNYGLLNDRWDRAKGSISSAFFVMFDIHVTISCLSLSSDRSPFDDRTTFYTFSLRHRTVHYHFYTCTHIRAEKC